MDKTPIKEADTLLVTIDYYPNVGGAARYLSVYAKKNNWAVLCGDPEFGGNEGLIRKKLSWRLWPKWLPLLFWGLVYAKKYKNLVISHILPAGYLGLISGKPYALILHGLDIKKAETNRWKKYWAGKILNRADKIITNSRATGELLRKIFGEKYNYNVHYPLIEPAREPDENTAREKLGFKGKLVILSVGRLVKRKGQEKIIKLMPKILEEFPNAMFVIAGSGPMRQELEELMNTFGVQFNVKFLGKVKDADLPDIYSASDLVVMPSLPSKDDWEGFGMVCLEAAYFRKPIIVTNVGGLPEAVENGVTGFIIKTDEELYQKIMQALKDKNLRNNLGDEGRDRVEEKFLLKL